LLLFRARATRRHRAQMPIILTAHRLPTVTVVAYVLRKLADRFL